MQKEKADLDLLLGMGVMQIWIKEDEQGYRQRANLLQERVDKTLN